MTIISIFNRIFVIFPGKFIDLLKLLQELDGRMRIV